MLQIWNFFSRIYPEENRSCQKRVETSRLVRSCLLDFETSRCLHNKIWHLF